MTDPAEIARKLSKAQRFAVEHARHWEGNGVWNPAGIYLYADKRVRHNLVRLGIIRDYLRENNRLTPLGLAVRQAIQEENDE